MNTLELLAPAGNYTKFLAAIENGANAIYMGLNKFNARAMSENFTTGEFIEAIKYAHLKDVKIYLTSNTLMYDEDMKDALNAMVPLVGAGLDGVIIQDLGLASLIHEVFPNLEMHASTQMAVTNAEGARVAKKLGFSRVVIARECTLSDMEDICKNVDIETEVFVHGAACVCYSGICSLSHLISDRSGNKGTCAQPCRYFYDLYDGDNEKIASGHLLSNKDIYGLEFIKNLSDMGVTSLKIEGRNKMPNYVATVISTYKKYIDELELNGKFEVSKTDKDELKQIFNRGGLHTNYFEAKKGKDSVSYECPKNWGVVLGKIVDIDDNMICVSLSSDIDMHDGIEVLDGSLSGLVTCILDSKKKLINNKVKAGTKVWLGDFKNTAKVGDTIYKTSSNELTNRLKDTFSGNKHFVFNELTAYVKLAKGENVTLEIFNMNHTAKVVSEFVAEESTSAPITEDVIKSKLSKTNNTPFKITNFIIDLEDGLFIPISGLNKLKQEAIDKLTEEYNMPCDTLGCYDKIKELTVNNNISKDIDNESSYVLDKPKKDILIYKYKENYNFKSEEIDRIYIDYTLLIKSDELIYKLKDVAEVFVSLPTVFRSNTRDLIKSKINNWKNICDGFLIGNIAYFDMLDEFGDKKVIGDFTLNITNKYTLDVYKSLGLIDATLSIELDEEHINAIGYENASIITSGPIQAMTTEFCPVGSFAGGFDSKHKCGKPCMKSNNYYLLTGKKEKLNIICDPTSCSSRLFKDTKQSLDINSISVNRTRKNMM